MKITIDLESDGAGKGLFYWLLSKHTEKSLPIGAASQWYYEAGKALYEMTEDEVTEALQTLRDNKTITVIREEKKVQL